jgi:glutathione peroxidase-family protein
MTKQLSLFLIGFFLTLASTSQSIYNLSFTNIDGGNVFLSNFQNKRLVFIITPTIPSDTAKFDDIKNFQLQYGSDSIQLIGVMSIEDGYVPANNSDLKNHFQNKGINIILTSGMQTKKEAGSNQSTIMKWLTDINQNNILNHDAHGIGHKFFVNRTGKLVGFILSDFSTEDSMVSIFLSSNE